ncbi:MAG: 4'-phosphopantetheinyl transferase superfamily protein [Planctomycetota bacterium]
MATGTPSRLHIWHAAASDDAPGRLETHCESLLDSEELAAADRFRVATARNQHVVGRGMVRWLLGGASVPPQRIRFGCGDHGKPFVVEPAAARQPFNIAHTDGLVLCGIADNETLELVGVDVEPMNRRTTTDLAERYFSPPEVAALRAQPNHEQKRFFLRIWTLKESFIKALGTGLSTPLADFAFHDIESDSPSIEFLAPELDDGRDWRFFCFEPRLGFLGAAAVRPASGIEAVLDCRPFEPFFGEEDADAKG